MQEAKERFVSSSLSQMKALFSNSVVWLMGLWGITLTYGYAVVRPAIEAMYNKAYGPEKLPMVWLVVAGFVGIVVTIYNHFSRKLGLLSLFKRVTLITGMFVILLLLGLQISSISRPIVFCLYVWKDAYIVIFIEIFWSFANLISRLKAARWTYGLFLFMGSLGQFVGHYTVGPMAKIIGSTERILWLIIPVLGLGLAVVFFLERATQDVKEVMAPKEAQTSLLEKLKSIRGSSYLLYMLLLVGVVQIVINLIDFQYSEVLEKTYPTHQVDSLAKNQNTTFQTDVKGKLHSQIDLICIVLNLMTGLILRFLGVATPLLGTPIVVGISVIGGILRPGLLWIGLARIASKSLDYSIFKSSRELLYLPLSYTEKVQGKSLIDMFVYRFGKAFAAALLIPILAYYSQQVIGFINLWLIGGWGVITVLLLVRYHRKLRTQKDQIE